MECYHIRFCSHIESCCRKQRNLQCFAKLQCNDTAYILTISFYMLVPGTTGTFAFVEVTCALPVFIYGAQKVLPQNNWLLLLLLLLCGTSVPQRTLADSHRRFLNLIWTLVRTLWTSDRPVANASAGTGNTSQKEENKHPCHAGFKSTISASKCSRPTP
jgi:hypothetical protein